MRLPRLRLRTLLIAVAVVAVVLWVWAMGGRQEYCLDRARRLDALHDTYLSRSFSDHVSLHPIDRRRHIFGTGCGVVAMYPAWADRMAFYSFRAADVERELERDARDRDAARYRAKAEECLRLAARYRHVARYPWLPVPRGPE